MILSLKYEILPILLHSDHDASAGQLETAFSQQYEASKSGQFSLYSLVRFIPMTLYASYNMTLNDPKSDIELGHLIPRWPWNLFLVAFITNNSIFSKSNKPFVKLNKFWNIFIRFCSAASSGWNRILTKVESGISIEWFLRWFTIITAFSIVNTSSDVKRDIYSQE